MSRETVRRRRFRRFAFGAVEQLATIFGAITASVLTIGLFLPALNSISGGDMIAHSDLFSVARLVLLFSGGTAVAAFVLRGMARMLEDDREAGDMG